MPSFTQVRSLTNTARRDRPNDMPCFIPRSTKCARSDLLCVALVRWQLSCGVRSSPILFYEPCLESCSHSITGWRTEAVHLRRRRHLPTPVRTLGRLGLHPSA
jgi:hypothetical protein